MQIKNVKVYGLEESMVRSGYPMQTGEPEDLNYLSEVGRPLYLHKDSIYRTDNVHNKRSKKLANTPIGSGHSNFLKGIIVQFDLQHPEYFSPQLQRYKFVDIISSQSKMHRITSRKLTKEDFTKDTREESINYINTLISIYQSSKELNIDKSKCFRQIISNLPSGYLKWMGISTNYQSLKTIYFQRCKHKHKLNEWAEFGEFIETLPMAKELILNE